MNDGLYTEYTVTFTYRPFGLLAVRDGRWTGHAWSYIDAFDRAAKEFRSLPEYTPLYAMLGDEYGEQVAYEMRYNPLFIRRPKYRNHRVRLLTRPKVGQTVYYHIRPCGWGVIASIANDGTIYASFDVGSLYFVSGPARDFLAVFPVKPRRMAQDDSTVPFSHKITLAGV